MHIFPTILVLVFIWINIAILWSDITERRVPNSLLVGLIWVLPFWFLQYPIASIGTIFPYVLLSGSLLICGIFLYRDNWFLGSGDIKYAAILALFMGHHSIAAFVGNIAVLTLLCFFVWLIIILGYIYRSRWSLSLDVVTHQISPKIPKNEIYLYILAYILDWGIVGFILSQLIPQIWIMLSYRIDMNENIYFLIFLIVYMIRPWSNYLITRWKYNIIPIFWIFIYFGLYIQNNGISTLYSEISHYISSLWLYILLYIIIRYISTTIYGIYDHSTTIWWWEYIKTIPYSIVLFIAFMAIYSLDIHIMEWMNMIP